MTAGLDPTQLEQDGWAALSKGTGADFYRNVLADDALMVLPNGVMGRDATIEAFLTAPQWTEFKLDDVQEVTIGPDAVLVTYRATASRGGDEPRYEALMSSVYRRTVDGWRLVLHQQTPVS